MAKKRVRASNCRHVRICGSVCGTDDVRTATESVAIREEFAEHLLLFETFENAATVLRCIEYETRICFCCVVAFQKVLLDTSASQTVLRTKGPTVTEAAAPEISEKRAAKKKHN